MSSTLPTEPPSTTALAQALHHLDVASAQLRGRHEAPSTVRALQAGNVAIDAIDATLAALYESRAALVTELRREADESAERVDAILAHLRTRGAA